MKDEFKYEALARESEEAEMSSSSPSKRKKNRQKKAYALAFSLGCVTTFILGLVGLAIQHSGTESKTAVEIEAEEWNNCGRSSDEARRRGCVMEPMFYGWMPPQCVFRELSEKHPILDDRPYYRDYNMTEPVTTRELWDGVYPTMQQIS